MALTTRNVCTYRTTTRCIGDQPKTRKRCTACGSTLATIYGSWGVFVWNTAGVYRRDDALTDLPTEARAEAWRERQHDDSLVVRWISL